MNHVFVTGASSGIGKAIVETLLAEGNFVWAALRKPEALAELKSRSPSQLETLKFDVTSPDDIANAVRAVSAAKNISSFALINNAGVATGGPLEALPMQEWRDLFEVNVFGLVMTTQAFLPLLREHKGRVINIGSVSGRIASPYLAPYAASKFAVRAISDSLRREMIPFGVQVVLLEPGAIKTEIWEKNLNRSEEMKSRMSPEHLKVYASALEGLVDGVKGVAAGAVPVDHVTKQVVYALNTPKPPPNILIGKGIRTTMFVSKVLPTKLLDSLILKGMVSSKMKRD